MNVNWSFDKLQLGMLRKIEARIVRNDIKNLTLFIHVFEFVITLFGIHHPVHFLRRFFSFSFSRWRSFWVYRCRCNTIASVHLHFWVRKIYAAHWFGVAWVTHYLLNCSAFNFGKNIYVQYHLCSGPATINMSKILFNSSLHFWTI